MEKSAVNITPLTPFAGLPPLHNVNQATMRNLRKLADRKGSSVEQVIREAVNQWLSQCEVEGKLKKKIIRFPNPNASV
jgi:hypothetical protein